MSPEDAEKQIAELIEQSNQLVVEATQQAILATSAMVSGNFAEYWADVGRQAQERVNEQYERAKAATQQNEPGDSSGE